MEKIFSAKTLDEAKYMAGNDFDAAIEDIDFEILAQPKKSIFGGLKGDYTIKAIYTPPVNEPVKKSVISEPEDLEEFDTKDSKNNTVKSENKSDNSAKNNKTDSSSKKSIKSLPSTVSVNDERIVKAGNYLKRIISELGYSAQIDTVIEEDIILFNIAGENLGLVIGKRGETLDSLQYIVSFICNRKSDEYYRISVDCNGYRQKRKETLEDLACKVARKVIKTGRTSSLEPMNSYERRIIHSKIAELDGVISRSQGVDPHRCVVILQKRNKDNKNFNKRNS